MEEQPISNIVDAERGEEEDGKEGDTVEEEAEVNDEIFHIYNFEDYMN